MLVSGVKGEVLLGNYPHDQQGNFFFYFESSRLNAEEENQYRLDNLYFVCECPGANESNFLYCDVFSLQNVIWVRFAVSPVLSALRIITEISEAKTWMFLGSLEINKYVQITQVANKVLWLNKTSVVIWLKSEFRNFQLCISLNLPTTKTFCSTCALAEMCLQSWLLAPDDLISNQLEWRWCE